MSSTNKTTNIELSQYIATDKPTYLVDYNGDMLKIDNAIGADRDSIATAQTTANTANEKADANATAIQTLDTELNDPSTGIAAGLTDVVGDVNTIESLIGNGTPTAGDQTIIGAENANTTAIGDLTQLDTTEKTNLVGAINEVYNGGNLVAELSAYADRLRNKKVLILGDSLSIATGTWAEVFKTFVEGNGGTVVNRSVSGYTLTDIATAITNESATDYDTVIIFAGTNDCMSALSTFKTNAGAVANGARVKFVNSEIFWITPVFSPKRSVTNYDDLGYGVTLSQSILTAVIANICTYNGINCIDGMSLLSVAPDGSHLSDGLHIAAAYAPYVCAWVFNKICSYVNGAEPYSGYFQNFDATTEIYSSVDRGFGTAITPTSKAVNVHITKGGEVHYSIVLQLPATTLDKGICLKLDSMLGDFIMNSPYGFPNARVWDFNAGTGVTRVYRNFLYRQPNGDVAIFIDTSDLASGIDLPFQVQIEGVNYDALTFNSVH